ncbi:hypothetical protein [uncultured Methylobacterium sp.]|uniref:hypothetical protein n=1 Tax=uncultured Methylobacterium sp. TaxID=157278 RepID=UPI0035C9B55D
MRRSSALAAFLVLVATGAAPAQTAAPDADARPDGHGMVGEPLEPGANSFTEAQVKERFGRMGFGEVKDLRKDASGIWHGTAVHAGQDVQIGMDFKGSVAAQ